MTRPDKEKFPSRKGKVGKFYEVQEFVDVPTYFVARKKIASERNFNFGGGGVFPNPAGLRSFI
jgi:hypothetical protein